MDRQGKASREGRPCGSTAAIENRVVAFRSYLVPIRHREIGGLGARRDQSAGRGCSLSTCVNVSYWPEAAVPERLLLRRCLGISRHPANGSEMTRLTHLKHGRTTHDPDGSLPLPDSHLGRIEPCQVC